MATTTWYNKFSKAYATLAAEKTEIEQKMKKLKTQLAEKVIFEEDRKVTTPYATMFFKAGSVRETVDLATMKKDDAELYAILEQKGYIKRTEVKESFDIKCKAVLIEKK
jgi:cell division septum initiation protein DivIVA